MSLVDSLERGLRGVAPHSRLHGLVCPSTHTSGLPSAPKEGSAQSVGSAAAVALVAGVVVWEVASRARP